MDEKPKKRKQQSLKEKRTREKIFPKILIPPSKKPVDTGDKRYWIVGTTQEGLKLYYVDDVVGWSLNRRNAIQFYGGNFTNLRIVTILKTLKPKSPYEKSLVLTRKKIPPREIDSRMFAENYYEDPEYFERQVRYERKCSNKRIYKFIKLSKIKKQKEQEKKDKEKQVGEVLP